MGGLRKYLPITYWTSRHRHARADRLPGLLGLLLEGRADRGRARVDDAGAHARVLGGAASASSSRRSTASGCCSSCSTARSAWTTTRRSTCTRRRGSSTGAADRARDSVGRHRLAHDRAGAVRRLLRAFDLRPRRARTRCRDRRRGIPRPGRRSCCTRFHALGRLSRAAGALVAWFLYLKRPDLPARLLTQFGALHRAAHEQVLLRLVQRERAGARRRAALGCGLWKVGDQTSDRRRARQRQRASRRPARRASRAASNPATSITTRSR